MACTLSPPATVSMAAADGAFPTRRFARRSDARSSAPAAETPRAECPCRPRSWMRLWIPGDRTRRPEVVVRDAVCVAASWGPQSHDHVADGTELDPVPGAGQRGFGTVEVPHLRSGAADQLPASRATCADIRPNSSRPAPPILPGPRCGGTPARNLQRLVLAHHVPKAGGEPREGNGPDLAGVGCDDAVGTEAGQLPHFGEVLAVVHGVNDHQAAGLLSPVP